MGIVPINGSTLRDLADWVPLRDSLISGIKSINADYVLTSFDGESSRQVRYDRLWSYYENEQYSALALEERARETTLDGHTARTAQLKSLYAFIQSFYNPVTQTVDMDVDSIFGGEGVHFDAEGDNQQESLDEIVFDSNLEIEAANLVRYGATNGDVYIRVHWDSIEGTVKLFVYTPDMARLVYNPHDKTNPDYGVVSYDYNEIVDEVNEEHNRTDIITATSVMTYRDGELYDFDETTVGGMMNNPLGYVSLHHVKNLDIGKDQGVNTFHHIIPTLDAINEVFSFLVNIVKINADPTILAFGIQQGEMEKGKSDNPYTSTVFYIPSASGDQADVRMLEWTGNLPDVLGLLKEIKEDVVNALPEMHVSKMQQQGAYSGQALNAMMFAFIRKISRMRKTYTHALALALSQAMWLKAWFEDANIADYDPRDKTYKVKFKLPSILPVDEDLLLNRVMAKMEAGILGPEDALAELGYPEDEIPEILSRAEAWAEKKMQREIKKAKANRPMTAGITGANGPAGAAQRQAAKATNNQPLNKQLNSG